MGEDAETAQARLLAALLKEQISAISNELDAEANLDPEPQVVGDAHDHRRDRLRRQLSEAHRLIDNLYRRFPQVLDSSATVQPTRHQERAR
jgi:hypothetical protein